MKIGEEVVHSSRRSSKSYLCTESGQPHIENIDRVCVRYDDPEVWIVNSMGWKPLSRGHSFFARRMTARAPGES